MITLILIFFLILFTLTSTGKAKATTPLVKDVFQWDKAMGKLVPGEQCQFCEKRDFCLGYIHEITRENKDYPEFPCDNAVEGYPSFFPIYYDDICDYCPMENCEWCNLKGGKKRIPYCGYCFANKFCDGILEARCSHSDLQCEASSTKTQTDNMEDLLW